MKKITLLFVAALIILTVNAQNLLINPSFTTWTGYEDGTPDGATKICPDNWDRAYTGSGSGTITALFYTSTDIPIGSTGNSWRVVMSGSSTGSKGTIAFQSITAPNGSSFDVTKTYKVSIKAKLINYSGSSTNSNIAKMYCQWFESNGTTEITPAADKPWLQGYLTLTTTDWVTYSYNCTTPANAKTFMFKFITMRSGTEIIWDDASFAALPQISVASNDIEQGTVTGGGNNEVGESVTVVASAKAGYQFVNWTENGTEVSTDASYTFTASADRSLVANFSLTTNIEGIDSKIRIVKTSTGISATFNGESEVELYNSNGMLLEKTNSIGSYSRTLNNGIYLIRINGVVNKIVL